MTETAAEPRTFRRGHMIIFRALFFSFLFGIGGALLGTIVGAIIASAINMPAREGGPGYFAIAIGIFLGLACAIGGFFYTLISAGLSTTRIGLGTVAAFATLALGLVTFRWFYRHSQAYFTSTYSSVPLEFEVLLPVGSPRETEGFAMAFDEGDGDNRIGTWTDDEGDVKSVEGRNVLAGYVPLYKVTSKRSLLLQLPKGSGIQTFRVKLPSYPIDIKKKGKWSEWESAASGGDYRIRYRVRMRD